MRESIRKGIRMLWLPVAIAVAGSFALAEAPGTQRERPDRDAKKEVRVSKKRGPKAPAGQYIVALEENIRGDLAARSALLSRVENLGGEVYRRYSSALNGGFAATLSAKALEALQRSPYVAFVEPDEVIGLTPEQVSSVEPDESIGLTPEQVSSVEPDVTAGGTELWPVNVEWGADRLDQRDPTLDGRADFCGTGSRANVYLLDTGIRYTHEVFQDPEGNSKARRFFDAFGGSGEDCNGHGTHNAGTVHSIAPDAALWSVKVLDCRGSGSMSGVVAGMDRIIAAGNPHGGVAVIPLGGGVSLALDNMIQDMASAGFAVVVAGANGNDACHSSPGRVSDAITVGVTNEFDTVPNWSSYGSCIDMFAPGVAVRSAWHECDTCYNELSGASMAAAYAAGVGALSAVRYGTSLDTFLEANATPNVLHNVPGGTPNLLLYASAGGTCPANMASAHNLIVDDATEGVVGDAGPDSPNRLLYLEPGGHLYFQTPGNWGLDRGNQRNLPLDGDMYYAGGGVGVHVYVVGSGIRMTHEEFTGRADCFFDWEQDNNCADELGGGTYVASLVAGQTYGWAMGAQVHAVRTSNDFGSSSPADVEAGLDAIVAEGEIPGVVVLPIGFPAGDETVEAAVQRVIEAGFYVVAAAGSDDTDACNWSPARVPEILTVGATDSNDIRASFSGWGSCVDLFAPGVDIMGADSSDDTATTTQSGTHAAAAFVAGAVAIHAERNNLGMHDPR